MKSRAPEPAEVEETFAVLGQDRGTVHRQLITRLYLDPKAWYQVKGEHGDNLLLAAIRKNHVEAVSLLLKKGFPADAWNDRLETGLHLTESPVVCGLLLARTNHSLALEANEAGDLPLHTHIRRGNTQVVQMLLASPFADAQILRRNAKRQTPLFDAAARNWECVLQMLLMGADPRLVDSEGRKPEDCTSDEKTRKKLQAFCAHFDRCDEAMKDQALNVQAAQKSASLAQRARQLILQGEPPDSASPAPLSTQPTQP